MLTTANILLTVVAIGFALFVWAGGLPSGPEGAVGAWIIPVPFLLLLAAVMTASILKGRFDLVPGGKLTAALALVGFLIAASAALMAAFGRRHSPADFLFAALPFVILAPCFQVVNAAAFSRWRVPALAVLGLASLCGWGLAARAFVVREIHEMESADAQASKDRAQHDARAVQVLAEYRMLPPDAPLKTIIEFEFAADQTVQNEARARIAAWPNLDDEIARILVDERNSVTSLQWTISYIAELHASPSARLAPAYARLLDRAYHYWESTMRNDEYAAKYEFELRSLFTAAGRIQKAGGDLRPQLEAWRDLLKQARGLGGVASYVRAILAASHS